MKTVIIFLAFVAAATAERYYCPCGSNGLCADGSGCGFFHMPNWCCSTRPCDGNCDWCGAPCRTARLGNPTSPESAISVLSEALHRIDTDGNGLEFHEFNDYAESKVPFKAVVRTLFQIVDKDGDGKITAEEFLGKLSDQREADTDDRKSEL